MNPGLLVLRDFLLEQGCSPAQLRDAQRVWQEAEWRPAAWPLAYEVWLSETPSSLVRTAHADGLATALQLGLSPGMVETSQVYMSDMRETRQGYVLPPSIGSYFDFDRTTREWVAVGFELQEKHEPKRQLPEDYALITALFVGHPRELSIETPAGWAVHTNAHRERYLVKWWP